MVIDSIIGFSLSSIMIFAPAQAEFQNYVKLTEHFNASEATRCELQISVSVVAEAVGCSSFRRCEPRFCRVKP
jgi:hypothetical protein